MKGKDSANNIVLLERHIRKGEWYMKKFLAVVLTIAMGAVLLAGCGSSSGSTTASGNSAGSAGSTASSNSASTASSGSVITIRYGSADAEDAAVVQGLYEFKSYVESESNGTIKVEPYINGVLGGDRELCEALQLGTVDMTIVMGGILANYDQAFNIFGLPYLWNSKDAAYNAVDGDFGDAMKTRSDSIGFKLLGYGFGGTYEVGAVNKNIKSKSDLNGFKIRVPEIDIDLAYFQALGATPTPVSFSETYTALQQKVVDGLELSVELMYCSQYFDAIDSITMTNHYQCIFPILMSPSCWNKLSADQQKIVTDGIAKQVAKNREVSKNVEEEDLQKFKDMGKTVNELSDADMKEFTTVGESIQDQYKDIVGEDLLNMAKKYNK